MSGQESLWELVTGRVAAPDTLRTHIYKWKDLPDRYKNFLGTERHHQEVELTIKTEKYGIVLRKLQR